MKYTWFEEHATSKKGAYKEYKTEWEVDRYMIRNKMFAMHGGDGKAKRSSLSNSTPCLGSSFGSNTKVISSPDTT